MLNRAEALINSAPDSAVSVLDSLKGELTDMRQSQQMRYWLLRTSAENQLDSTLHRDSIMRLVADYYDHHGTPNESMLAFYLLGRTYADRGEAPQALDAYHDAVDASDTTATDCNYRQLSRVYGQMASLFYIQNMPYQQLSALNYARQYSLQAKDTLSASIFFCKRAGAYELLGKKDSVRSISVQSYNSFKKNGYTELAAQSLAQVIFSDLECEDYASAKHYLEEYEDHSGFVDGMDVAEGAEYYYYAKALYLIGIKEPRMAETYLRRMLSTVADNVDGLHTAYTGLCQLYQATQQKDSIVKYALLSSDYNDSIYAHAYTEELQQMQSMYNYSRFQVAAKAQELRAEKVVRRNIVLAFTLFCVILITIAIVIYDKNKKEKTRLVYEHNLKLLEMAQEDLMMLMQKNEKHYTDVVEKRKEQISQLKKKLRLYHNVINKYNGTSADDKLMTADIVQTFRAYAKNPTSIPTNQEWTELRDLFINNYPSFYVCLHENNDISMSEYDMCMLVRLRFKASDIANLMNYSRSSVTLIRQRLHKKVIGKAGTASDFDDFLFSIE